MKMQKHDPETDMEMNMTPMIDVVFLLIIFFMIITDMTQQELEELELPLALNAVEDKPNPDELRPIINVLQGGTMIVRRQVYHDPESEDRSLRTYERLQDYLVTRVAQMTKAPLSDSNPMMVPEDPVLVRADEFTPFRHVQKIMEICGMTGIQIWKIELAAKTPEN